LESFNAKTDEIFLIVVFRNYVMSLKLKVLLDKIVIYSGNKYSVELGEIKIFEKGGQIRTNELNKLIEIIKQFWYKYGKRLPPIKKKTFKTHKVLLKL
jgi:hypothetical protein